MLVRDNWEVLVVDDDPDVLAVTRLALKQLQVYGIPLRIRECRSKREAIEYLARSSELPDIALAIVDVVMETEDAGLEVCKFIRDELGNRTTQIVVRTGQAGKAPEREVVEQYDISTYLTKVEATNEKLYATTVNAIRNYQMAVLYDAVFGFASWLILQDREGIVRGIPEVTEKFRYRRDGSLLDNAKYHYCILTEGEPIAVGDFIGKADHARELRDQLKTRPARMLNAEGDRFVLSDSHTLLSLGSRNGEAPFDVVGKTNYRLIADPMARQISTFARCVRDRLAMVDRVT